MASSNKTEKKLSLQTARRRLMHLPRTARHLMAYSGGVDSHVLLWLLHGLARQFPEFPAPLAVHIDHALHKHSAEWAEHCRRICTNLGVEFLLRHVPTPCPAKNSVEGWARQQRYALLAELMQAGDCLLTAHHADDQFETVLAHLLRGSGPGGLAAMSPLQSFARGWHARPLLDFTREQIRKLAQEQELDFLQDPANDDPRFTRSYLRAKVVPALRQRWPGLAGTAGRVARHQRELVGLLDELASEDLPRVSVATSLDVEKLKTLSIARQSNVLRHWLERLSLPPPHTVHLEQILEEVLCSDYSRIPCVCWPGAELRRYRHRLYATPPLPTHDPSQVLDWSPNSPLSLPLGNLSMGVHGPQGTDTETLRLNRQKCSMPLQVRFRQGGERIRLAGAQHHRRVKHLLQETGILPWYRDRIPLLYAGGHLAAIPGIGVTAELAATPGEAAWELCWQHSTHIRAV